MKSSKTKKRKSLLQRLVPKFISTAFDSNSSKRDSPRSRGSNNISPTSVADVHRHNHNERNIPKYVKTNNTITNANTYTRTYATTEKKEKSKKKKSYANQNQHGYGQEYEHQHQHGNHQRQHGNHQHHNSFMKKNIRKKKSFLSIKSGANTGTHNVTSNVTGNHNQYQNHGHFIHQVHHDVHNDIPKNILPNLKTCCSSSAQDGCESTYFSTVGSKDFDYKTFDFTTNSIAAIDNTRTSTRMDAHAHISHRPVEDNNFNNENDDYYYDLHDENQSIRKGKENKNIMNIDVNANANANSIVSCNDNINDKNEDDVSIQHSKIVITNNSIKTPILFQTSNDTISVESSYVSVVGQSLCSSRSKNSGNSITPGSLISEQSFYSGTNETIPESITMVESLVTTNNEDYDENLIGIDNVANDDVIENEPNYDNYDNDDEIDNRFDNVDENKEKEIIGAKHVITKSMEDENKQQTANVQEIGETSLQWSSTDENDESFAMVVTSSDNDSIVRSDGDNSRESRQSSDIQQSENNNGMPVIEGVNSGLASAFVSTSTSVQTPIHGNLQGPEIKVIPITIGTHVSITSGKYQGKNGKIVKMTKMRVKVYIEGIGETGNIPKTSVVSIVAPSAVPGIASIKEIIEKTDPDAIAAGTDDVLDDHKSCATVNSDTVQSNDHKSRATVNSDIAQSNDHQKISINEVELREGMKVSIKVGRYKNKSGIVKRTTTKKVYLEIDGEEKCLMKTSICIEEIKVDSPNIMIDDKTDVHESLSQLSSFENNDSITDCDILTENNDKIRSQIPSLQVSMNNYVTPHHNHVKGVNENSTAQDTNEQHEISPTIGTTVFITGGMYENETATILKICPSMVMIKLKQSGKNTRVKKKFIALAKNGPIAFNITEIISKKATSTNVNGKRSGGRKLIQLKTIDTNNEWRLPDSTKSGYQIGTRFVTKLRLESNPKEENFLSHLLGNRMLTIDIPMNKEELTEKIKENFDFFDSSCELISSKIVVDEQSGGLPFCKQKVLKLAYAKVSGPGLQQLSLKEELERIADFASLSTRKVVSRLELLLSPSHKFSKNEYAKFFLRCEDFCEIEERGHTGCGFISDDFLTDLLGGGKVGKETICVQIRAFIPKLGIFKGMLMKKKIRDGSPPIQFPDSMKKVGPALATSDEKAMLIICQAGIDPSKYNHSIGRLPSIDDNAKPPPKKSFDAKELSPMIKRLLYAVKVPKQIVDEYSQNSRKRKNPSHTYVRGVCDPTGTLPPGHVFLTGVKNKSTLDDMIFVTRSPCIKWTDGRMMKVVTERPTTMPNEDFEYLQSMPFGVIIFAFPRNGMKPMPEMIAGGDLDGDRYFVCWERNILKYVQAEPMIETPCEAKKEVKDFRNEFKISTVVGDTVNSLEAEKDWFQLAKERMANTTLHDIGQLIGSLYNASNKAADADQERFMKNPDAEAFADAYYQALENGKHGTKIVLPKHLHDKLPKHLQQYLSVP